MKTINLMFVLGLVAWLGSGCATQPVVLNPVGPAQNRPSPPGSRGYLRVYSATETDQIGEGTYYYPHTSYRIYDGDGRLVKFVPNHIGNMDESAALVSLPAGQYRVKAQSDIYGWVMVPVVVEAGEITSVHLQSIWPGPGPGKTHALVRLPDGRPVGWKYELAGKN